MVSGEVSSREATEACLGRIDEVNPAVNAVVTVVADRAMDAAAEADQALVDGGPRGPLHGLPIAHKDLALTKGIRTTSGSPIFADFVPDEDELFVQRIRDAGAIVVGKTNTPEFGAGSQTFNEVFGARATRTTCRGPAVGPRAARRRPWRRGMVPIADGSDLADRYATPPASATSWGSVPPGSRAIVARGRQPVQVWAVDGPDGLARWRTPPCCCRAWRARRPRCRCPARTGRRVRASAGRRARRARGGVGARRAARCPSIRTCARSCTPPAPPSRPWGAARTKRSPTCAAPATCSSRCARTRSPPISDRCSPCTGTG